MTNTKLVDLGTEIDQLKRQAIDNDIQLGLQKDEEKKLRDKIRTKGLEIVEKDNMIGDKEKKIYSLKKKT